MPPAIDPYLPDDLYLLELRRQRAVARLRMLEGLLVTLDGERARALDVPRPPRQCDGQAELFGEMA